MKENIVSLSPMALETTTPSTAAGDTIDGEFQSAPYDVIPMHIERS